MNNRVVTYEVTLVDQYLNRSAVKILAPLKIEHKGNIDKEGWTLTTNGLTATNVEAAGSGTEEDPCAPAIRPRLIRELPKPGRRSSWTSTRL